MNIIIIIFPMECFDIVIICNYNVYVHVSMYVNVCMYVHVHCMYVTMSVYNLCMYVCMYVCIMCVCVCMCMYYVCVCVCVCMYVRAGNKPQHLVSNSVTSAHTVQLHVGCIVTSKSGAP